MYDYDCEEESSDDDEEDDDEREIEESVKLNEIFQQALNFKTVDLKINEIVSDIKSINIAKDDLPSAHIGEDVGEAEIEDHEYDLSKENSSTFDDLIIELDDVNGHKIPRYSCTCHKCNLAIRKAIKLCSSFTKDMSVLKNYTKNIRKSNVKIKIFQVEKCRIRCENATRWSSAFLTIFSVNKAYKRGID